MSTNGAPKPTAAAAAAAAPAESVWSSLLSKSHRRHKERNSTLIVLGQKSSGLSSLLNRFADRISADVSAGTTAQSLSGSSGEYSVDYAFASVRNANAPAESKDDVLARMHMWALDDPTHAALIPTMMLSNQPPSAAALAAPSAPTTPPALQAATLDSTAIIVTFDLAEPWRAIESVRTWLTALQKVLTPALAALPPADSQSLRMKISKHIQSYHIASLSPSPDATGEQPEEATEQQPINAAIPAQNFGIPIILVGLRGDLFSRHLPSKSGADEQFEFLTRQMRKIALEYGAALIYTSVGGGRSSASRSTGVNLDTLQQYIFHRLYKFSLSPPAVEDGTQGGKQQPSISPKVVGGAEDYSIYLPSGYDSLSLLETTAKNAVSAAFSDSATSEEVFKGAGGGAGKKKQGSAQGQVFQTVHADDNTSFFRSMKVALEQGGAMVMTAAPTPVVRKPQPAPSQASTPAASVTATATTTAAAPSPSESPSPAAPSTVTGTPVKGQSGTAVKQFFRSLLNNTSSKTEGNTKAAAAQKAVRANAEKELQRMTDGQNQP
jgi:hypothetical protein